MVRTQIQLTEDQFAALRERAVAEGRSMADLVRTGVDSILRGGAGRADREERRRRALAVIGRYRSAPRDLSRRHDDYLAKAFR